MIEKAKWILPLIGNKEVITMAMQVTGANEHNLLVHQSENAQSRKEARLGNKNEEQVRNGSINMN